MKKTILYIPLLLIIISLTSFDLIKLESESITAVYSFSRNDSKIPLIQLKLNENNTFELVDRSNPKKIIDVKGNYSLKGNKVKLYDYNSEYSISTTWKIDSNSGCIKNRKGLKFTRICNCETD